MKKTATYSVLLSTIILLWGCPYESTVSLGEPVELIRPELLGSWVPETEMNMENPSYYTIVKFDSVKYDISHFQYNKENDEYSAKNYVGHTTSLEGFVFMNMVESGTKQFLMHRIDLVPSGFILYEVTDNIDEQFDSSADMQEFFRKNMRLSFFYNKDEVSLVKK